MEAWRRIWRDGFAPCISTPGLEALWHALRNDDKRLIQGRTSMPLPLVPNADLPVESCCGISFCGWQGEQRSTVADLDEYFARMCFDADQRLGEPAACRWFLNWFDDTPRQEMRLELLFEVERTLEQRSLVEILDKSVRGRKGRKSGKQE